MSFRQNHKSTLQINNKKNSLILLYASKQSDLPMHTRNLLVGQGTRKTIFQKLTKSVCVVNRAGYVTITRNKTYCSNSQRNGYGTFLQSS